MSVGVNAPKTPITAGSNGIAAATLPNVCKMPGPPAPFVPTPLPNIGKSDNSPQGYSKKVTIGGYAVAIQGATFNSMGDVASQGTGGGIVSNNVQGPTSFIGPGSLDVKIEGKNVQLLGDQMLNNGGPSGSPANAATMMGAMQAPAPPVTGTGKQPKPVKCKDAFPERKATDCEKEEICSKCKTINDKKDTIKRLPKDSAEKIAAQKDRDKKCAELNRLAETNPQEASSKIGFAATSDKCVAEAKKHCENNKFEGYSADHVVDVTLNGSPTAESNLKWMSSKANGWMGPVMQHYNPEKHDGVAPDCCD